MLASLGQAQSNLRHRNITIENDTTILDSLSVIPGTFYIITKDGNPADSSQYQIDYAQNILIAPSMKNTEVEMHYRVFDFSLTKPYSHKKFSDYKSPSDDSSDIRIKAYDWSEYDDRNNSKLQTSGSISRGISVGNNQDIIMNSSMNLQLNGEITPGVWIMGSITDNNIPIQPNGNSQQLQDFDKVFIKIYNDDNALTMGDFEVNSKNSNFLKYYKKSQGGMFETKQSIKNEKLTITSDAAYSSSKGRHCRQELEAIEGNQGPYPITGCQNEMYIVILSGTEKVYVDGQLLERGEMLDYVIDYNTATITFTSNFLITREKRIVVEFEYSDQNYARSLIVTNNEIKTEKTKTWINIYSEQDNKNRPYLRDLSDDDKRNLSLAGDNAAFGSGAFFDSTFNENSIYYQRVDTIIDNQPDSIYRYSTNPELALYRVNFSFVGEGSGHYNIKNASANGRVYEWTGKYQGAYLPIIQLIAPKQKQVFVMGNESTIGKYTIVETEIAVSKNDINTFSSKDSHDDVGQAASVSITQLIPLVADKHTLQAKIASNYAQKYFDPVDQFREVEFQRNWNTQHHDTLIDAIEYNTELKYINQLGFAAYGHDIFQKPGFYTGNRDKLTSELAFTKYRFAYNGSIMNSSDPIYRTSFIKSDADISRIMFRITKLGFNHITEDNKWREGDKLTIQSDKFNSQKVYYKTEDSLKNGFETSCQLRYDEAVDTVLNDFKPETQSLDIAAKLFFLKNANHQFMIAGTHRRLKVIDTTLLLNDENTNIGQIDYNGRFLKGMLSSHTFLEFGSGMERNKEYMYYFVGEGLGTYMWDKDKTDYNGNGVPDLNEFEIARYEYEANYIMIFVPGTEYVRTYVNQFNESINFDPYNNWKKHDDIRSKLALLSDRINYRITKKNRLDDFWINMNPFDYHVSDTDLVSFSKQIRNDVFLNRRSTKFNAQYIYSENENKTLTANGTDTKINLQHGIRTQWSPIRVLAINIDYDKTRKQSLSDAAYFSNRTYDIFGDKIAPLISIRPSFYFQVDAKYSYTYKHNVSELNEKAIFHSVGTEIKFSKPQKGRITAEFEYVAIEYDYITNNALTYVMLESLLPGNNFIWRLNIQKEIARNLQMSINYEGKKSENEKYIHTGSIQLRAYF